MTDADAIDRQIDSFRKAEGSDDNSQDSSVHNEARGAQIIQVNTLSTPVTIVILAVLTIVGMLAASSAVFSYLSERNAKLAQYQTEEAIKKWEEERRK